MQEHPIEGLMKTAMESIKEMVNISTVVGDAVEAPDGTVIIPVSRVACGFAAGGSEFGFFCGKKNKPIEEDEVLPFGGGSGAGVSVKPVGFLVVGHGEVRLMVVDSRNAFLERLIDTTPELIDQLQNLVCQKEKKTFNNDPQIEIMD
ncbi:MAG TPA: sporulation protein YtfJ [Clostridia bacterium]|jgi:sporulation protein YtfJ|nr:sporulation protein YtfJ [Clostridia bacterium]